MICFPCICSNVCGWIADVMLLLCTLVLTFSASVHAAVVLWSVVRGLWCAMM